MLPPLERLRALGVELSIDDFGSGFSSLTYIRRQPVSSLTLDRTLLTGAPEDRRAVSIIRSSVDLAHSLGLSALPCLEPRSPASRRGWPADPTLTRPNSPIGPFGRWLPPSATCRGNTRISSMHDVFPC
jgi:hypothetical protein